MEEHDATDSFAETVFRELRKTTPTVSLGFPPQEELQRRRTDREHRRWLRRQETAAREFQRLKVTAGQ